jgi:hypothetical protein
MMKSRIIGWTLVENAKENISLGRPRRRWVNSMKMHLEAIGWDGINWTSLAQVRNQWRAAVNAVINLRVS